MAFDTTKPIIDGAMRVAVNHALSLRVAGETRQRVAIDTEYVIVESDLTVC